QLDPRPHIPHAASHEHQIDERQLDSAYQKMCDYLLHESSVGYAIFNVKLQADTVGARLKEVQDAHNDLARFGKMVQLTSFAPFQGASQALENANDVSEGLMSDYLRTVLESNLPKASK
ncbi:hypothetical protein KC352_g47117, partial [Hortaea werneckii]